MLEAAKYVRVRRLLELDEELTEAEYDLLDTFDPNQPWFVDSGESPAASDYVLMFNQDDSPDMLRRQIRAIDQFVTPAGLPDGYTTRVIQLKQGLAARAFVPADSAWAADPETTPPDATVAWDTGSADRPVCVVVRPRGLTDGTVGLDEPAEGVPELLRRWNGDGMVVEVLPVWGEHSWRSADVGMPGGISPMTDGQVDALFELSVSLRIYANPREATLVGVDSGCYLCIRHAEKGSLFDPIRLAGAPVNNELVATRAAWVTERGLRTAAYDQRGGSSNVNTLLGLPFTARRVPDPPTTRLTGRPNTWELTGDKVIDRGLRNGREAVTRLMLYDRDIKTYDDLVRAFRERLRSLSTPSSVDEYATLVGLYLHAPLPLREQLGPLQLLREPAEAHQRTIEGLDARRYATVRALIAAEASFDPRHLSRATEIARRHPELDELEIPVDARDLTQLRVDLERIEEFLNPEGVEANELDRLMIVDFDPTRGVGIRLWRDAGSAGQSRVFVGVPDPETPGHSQRVGKVSPALRKVLRAHPEIAVAESWNRPGGVETSLPLSLFYVHTHQGSPERVFAEGSTGAIASRVYPRETRTVRPPWEIRLRDHLVATAGGRTGKAVAATPQEPTPKPSPKRRGRPEH